MKMWARRKVQQQRIVVGFNCLCVDEGKVVHDLDLVIHTKVTPISSEYAMIHSLRRKMATVQLFL